MEPRVRTPRPIEFGGELLKRGFWLYIWEVTPPKGKKLYYVGRTGDSSSANAQVTVQPGNCWGRFYEKPPVNSR